MNQSSQETEMSKARKLQFVAETSPHRPSQKNKKLIKSHVSRGRLRRKDDSNFKSWILRRNGKLTSMDNCYSSIPSRVGSDLSLISFPEVLKPYMQEDIVRCILSPGFYCILTIRTLINDA